MKRLAWLLILAAAVSLAVPALAEHTWYGTMMVDNCDEWVSLRDVPGTGGKRLAKVPLYAIVTDAEWEPICGDFIYCNYDGQYGYILSKYLTPWSDPEPEASDRFESELGFAFDYDASVLEVNPDGAGDGWGLILCPKEGDDPAWLQIMTEDSLGVPLEEYMRRNAPSDAVIEEDETEAGAQIRRFRKAADFGRDAVKVYYSVRDGGAGLAAIATCPPAGGEGWIAQFNAVIRSITFTGGAPVRADWAEATGRALVVDADGEYVTLMADEPITGVELLSLELADGGDAGVTFETEVIGQRDAMDEDNPFVVKIAFPGDIPSYGLRFTDASGEVRQFAIGLSGRDGSLILSEF